MNHDRIEIDLYKPGNEQVFTSVYQDSPDCEVSIIRDTHFVTVYTTRKMSQGYTRQMDSVIYPWRRIHEIRYYGER